jgi:SAM-dependent methyltransferase
MTGFSSDWLGLREAVDHRSRNEDVAQAVQDHFRKAQGMTVLDLGCGTGSNLRALAPHLPAWQSWTLVDHDTALLDMARDRLLAWADSSEVFGEELILQKDGKQITVDLRKADLTVDLEKVLGWRPSLVTAAALFDLCSPTFIQLFVAGIASRKLPFYTVLTYDGREEWTPRHQVDQVMLDAFNAHQMRDKGFGPSAGPRATATLEKSLQKVGYEVDVGDSPWLLTADDKALTMALADGIATAVRETGKVPDEMITAWVEARACARTGFVGHLDLFATPAK